MRLRVYERRYAVCRIDGHAPIPVWFSLNVPFAGLIRRGDELSLVAADDLPPQGTPNCERGWAALEVEGPIEFTVTGVLASIAQPLADAGVPIFALATYDTDVLLVKAATLDVAVGALENAGHSIA